MPPPHGIENESRVSCYRRGLLPGMYTENMMKNIGYIVTFCFCLFGALNTASADDPALHLSNDQLDILEEFLGTDKEWRCRGKCIITCGDDSTGGRTSGFYDLVFETFEIASDSANAKTKAEASCAGHTPDPCPDAQVSTDMSCKFHRDLP